MFCYYLLLIKIEKMGSFFFQFQSIPHFFGILETFFCGILDAAQPHPDSTSSGTQVN